MTNKNNKEESSFIVNETIEFLYKNDMTDRLDEIFLDPKSSDKTISKSSIKRIMSKVQMETGTEQKNKFNFYFQWRTVASVLVGIILIFTIINWNFVTASIKNALYFVPGLGNVVQNTNGDLEVYVLKKPIEVVVGNGKLIVQGASVDKNGANFYVIANNVPRQNKVSLIEGNGEKIKLNTHWSGSLDNWNSNLYYQKAINQNKKLTLLFDELDGLKIPITLTKSDGYEDYKKMGPTCTKNGITITAIPSFEYGKLKIDFVSQKPENYFIQSYGESGSEKVVLRDNKKEEISKWEHEFGFLPRNYVYYNVDSINENKYNLKIPFIVVEDYQSRATIDIDVPQKGVADINKTFEISGHKIKITKVMRIKPSEQALPDANILRIYVESFYDKKAISKIRSFDLWNTSEVNFWSRNKFMNAGFVGANAELSSSYRINEKTKCAEYYEINIHKNADKIMLLISKPEIELKGPWNFEFNSPPK